MSQRKGILVTPMVGSRRKPDPAVSDLLTAIQEALKAADPQKIVDRALNLKGDMLRLDSLSFDLSRFERILVIGGGKASGKMAAGVERVMGTRITAGVVNVPDYPLQVPRGRRILLHEATHPIPSEKGTKGVEMMLRMVGRPTSKDMIVCLLSGGGSALLPMPVEGVSIDDIQQTTDLLLRSGADIGGINSVRKHLSAIKGGRLAEKLYPATVLSLVISDVVGNRLDSIASGPTAPDGTTYAQAVAVLKEYGIWERAPGRVRRTLSLGAAGRIKETPKNGSNVFRRVSNVIVGDNKGPCFAAARSLRKTRYKTVLLSTRIQGEARDIGRLFSGILTNVVENRLPFAPPVAVIAGGETTVTVRGGGRGGRNQELVLSASVGIAGLDNCYIASVGTDGVDGPTHAAGALADSKTAPQARKLGMDPNIYLKNNDSNTFFKKVGGLVVTGPTGANVNDVMIAIVRK